MSETKILVVEDEVITAEVIADQLEQLGYSVTDTVSNGTEAFASIANNRPDLVLMDINLGRREVDGITIAGQVRSQFQIPVVFLTAHADDATLDRAKVTEPFGYIIKPFNERELRVAIENAIYKHQMERQLIEQKELLATILRSTADAVVATDNTGVITYMNPAAETMTGWSLAQAAGQEAAYVIPLIDETTGEPIEHPVQRVLQEERVVYLDDNMAVIAKDGSQTPVSDSASPLKGDTNNLMGAVVVFSDLSARRQAEVLEIEREKLATEVALGQKTEGELREFIAAEQELSELKSRLISMISHEYRTPLAIVQSSSELLQCYGSRLPDEKKEIHYQKIKTAIERMTKLVNDVLTFTQAEAGQLPFNPAPIDVQEFCRNLIEEQQLLISESHTLKFVTKKIPATANLDQQLLRQILINLLTNAIKYSHVGGTVTLRVFCITFPEGERILFQIKDQGIGIPTGEQIRLFSPFFRANNVGTISGTGMGLSIVKKCVELHGGQIGVESEVGKGTTVTIMLPLRLKEEKIQMLNKEPEIPHLATNLTDRETNVV